MKKKDEQAAVYLDPADLTPWDQNPRHNDHVVGEVARSIQRFGFASPIVARKAPDGSLTIVAGHTRHKAARKLGLDRVPVRLMDLSEDEAQMLALADNRMGELAEWSDGLREVLEELSERGHDLTGLGWGEDLPEFEDEIDLSVLDDVDVDLDEYASGVRRAIQIDFEPDDFEEAQTLVSEARTTGQYVGMILIQALRKG